MAISVTASLTVAGVVGMWFPNTRVISVGALALLVFLHPWLAFVVIAVAAAAFYFLRIRKSPNFPKEKS